MLVGLLVSGLPGDLSKLTGEADCADRPDCSGANLSNLSDLSDLADLANLTRADLADLADLSDLAELTELPKLTTDLTDLTECSDLAEGSDLGELPGLTDLTELVQRSWTKRCYWARRWQGFSEGLRTRLARQGEAEGETGQEGAVPDLEPTRRGEHQGDPVNATSKSGVSRTTIQPSRRLPRLSDYAQAALPKSDGYILNLYGRGVKRIPVAMTEIFFVRTVREQARGAGVG